MVLSEIPSRSFQDTQLEFLVSYSQTASHHREAASFDGRLTDCISIKDKLVQHMHMSQKGVDRVARGRADAAGEETQVISGFSPFWGFRTALEFTFYISGYFKA